MTLTPKRKAFVREVAVDGNYTQAAKRAGYAVSSAHTTGSALMQEPEIKALVAANARSAAENVGLNAEWVLTKLMQVAVDAHEHGSYSAAQQALQTLGRHLALFTTTIDIRLVESRAVELAEEYGVDDADIAEITALATRLLAEPDA